MQQQVKDTQDIEQGPEHVIDIALGLWKSQILCTALDLELFDYLGDDSRSKEEICEHLGIKIRVPEDFLDALVSLHLLQRENGRYSNTYQTKTFCSSQSPLFMGKWLLNVGYMKGNQWGSLKEWLQQEPQPPAFESYTQRYEEKGKQYTEKFSNLMNNFSTMAAVNLPTLDIWKKINTFADVGGNNGFVASHICQSHEHLKGYIADLPDLEEIYLQKSSDSLRQRLEFVPTDFFVNEFPKVDAIIFGHILMDWDLSTKKMLLQKAYNALNNNGYVIVYDHFVDDERNQKIQSLLMSIHMQMFTKGNQFTFYECNQWFTELGFTNIVQVKIGGMIDAMIGQKVITQQ